MVLKGTDISTNLEKLKNGMGSLVGSEPPCRLKTVADLSYSMVGLKVNGENLLGNNKNYLFVS